MRLFQIGPRTTRPRTAFQPMEARQGSESRRISPREERGSRHSSAKISLSLQTFGHVLNWMGAHLTRFAKAPGPSRRHENAEVPKWNQGAAGLSILTLAVAHISVFAQAPCALPTESGRSLIASETFSSKSPPTRRLTCGEKDGSLLQPGVHALAPYCAAYDRNRPNLHPGESTCDRASPRSVPVAP
jgi:hypothetical protein